jgi:putative phosphoesterase
MGKAGENAFVSDIHSNLEALTAVLSDFGEGTIYCLGDIVGYGASPNEVVEILKERGAVCIVGNHDYAALSADVGNFNARAGMAAVWTSRHLTDESRAYLTALPSERTESISGKKVYLTHGSPDDNLWEYVYEGTHRELFDFYLARMNVDAIALGHTHVPFVWSERRGVVFNPGSVGQPRAGDRRSSYAVLSVESGTITVATRSVEYDIESSAKKILDAGLPESFATRLFSGQ